MLNKKNLLITKIFFLCSIYQKLTKNLATYSYSQHNLQDCGNGKLATYVWNAVGIKGVNSLTFHFNPA